ncbi:restriction endonuclease subunit S [Pseudoalteromonas sp. SR41-1]|uniref:restriction endonuclease subunit S n=1 Tax=Pseudoalteromonas sp. SR41-1 TaxID=2760952 RepID=UPI001602D348|nr:restriction endonuclease subunit S [Pseudoalteromonas sp. SR41-1]MBB1280262.1 restriction endonuclease subunit S [Pseudoalteromonas sp. SR41-1]
MSELKASRYQAYPEYKDSNIDWLDSIPEHWTTSKLRYTFSFGKGLTITKENLRDTGIPCVNYGEVHSKYGFEVNPQKHPLKCVDEEYLKTSPYALLENGDIVFADTSEDIDGSGNFTQLVSDEQIFAGYHTIIARPFDRECSRFYAYLLDSKELRTQIRHAVKGVKVFSITQAILRGVNIWLPPLKERTQIASFLDHETAKIDTLIEKQEQLIKLLKEKRQAVISHAVTKGLNPQAPMKDSGVEWLGEVPEHWECATKIKYISSLKGRIGFQGLKADEYIDEGPYVVSSAHFNNHIIEWESCPHVSQERYEMDKNIQLSEGDILLMKDGAAMGKLAFVDYLPGKACLNSHLLLFRPLSLNKQYLYIPEYLYYLFQTDFFQGFIKVNGAGSTFLGISQQAIGNYQLVIPDINEQLMIANHLKNVTAKIDDLVKMQRRAINFLQERRTALISAAVTGKIDVRHWEQPND